jgi:CheY-like chemotaxis protein
MSPDAQPQILVVEDDELTREFVVDLIRSFGYPVAAASDSMAAMRTLEEAPSIALVFTDIAMPGVDGIMLADMVKQHRPRLKILYTTGGRDVTRMKATAGILHGNILAKPYRPAELRREIERILN